jgi:hypothetical protein
MSRSCAMPTPSFMPTPITWRPQSRTPPMPSPASRPREARSRRSNGWREAARRAAFPLRRSVLPAVPGRAKTKISKTTPCKVKNRARLRYYCTVAFGQEKKKAPKLNLIPRLSRRLARFGFQPERGGEQGAGVVGLRMLEQFRRRALLHHLAVAHHDQMAGQRGHHAQIVRALFPQNDPWQIFGRGCSADVLDSQSVP